MLASYGGACLSEGAAQAPRTPPPGYATGECPAYSSCREGFRAKFEELIGDSFEQLSDIDKTAYVLGSELWEENFEDTSRLMKEFIADVWEVRKQKLYGEDACPSHHQY